MRLEPQRPAVHVSGAPLDPPPYPVFRTAGCARLVASACGFRRPFRTFAARQGIRDDTRCHASPNRRDVGRDSGRVEPMETADHRENAVSDPGSRRCRGGIHRFSRSWINRRAAQGPFFLFALAAPLGVLLGVFLGRKGYRALLFAIAAYLIAILPMAGFITSSIQIIANRYAYFATAPFCVLFGCAFAQGWKRASASGRSFEEPDDRHSARAGREEGLHRRLFLLRARWSSLPATSRR